MCIDTYDLTRDGVPEIIVGHGDGTVEVYALDEAREPRIKFKQVSKCTFSFMCLMMISVNISGFIDIYGLVYCCVVSNLKAMNAIWMYWKSF